MTISRVPSGVPSGGQFSAAARGESQVDLSPVTPPIRLSSSGRSEWLRTLSTEELASEMSAAEREMFQAKRDLGDAERERMRAFDDVVAAGVLVSQHRGWFKRKARKAAAEEQRRRAERLQRIDEVTRPEAANAYDIATKRSTLAEQEFNRRRLGARLG